MIARGTEVVVIRTQYAFVLVFLASCTGSAATTDDTAEPSDSSTPTTPTNPECLFDLALWCFNSEGSGGPSATTGTCPVTTADELMAGYGAWRGQCEDPVHGTLEVVNQPTGYGGPNWYFDTTGALVAFTYGTDINTFCDGASFSAHYGFDPDCATLCLLEGPEDTGVAFGGLPPPC